MKYRLLGKTGLEVSEITLGTVELGLNYGFRGADHYQQPEPEEAIRLLHRAVDSGINLIDAAPSYGTAHQLIGKAFGGRSKHPYVASKVVVPSDRLDSLSPTQLCHQLFESIEVSLKALKTETIDLMQIHNTTVEIVHCEEVFSCLEKARQQGKIRFIGASADGEEAPFEALKNKSIQTVQGTFNLLNQKFTRRVFPSAGQQGVGVLVRSAYLRGVLTSQLNTIPDRLSPLRDSALGALKVIRDEVGSLAEAALRFCLSFSEVSSVIIGVRSVAELESNLADARKGPLQPDTIRKLRDFHVENETLVNPVFWQDLI